MKHIDPTVAEKLINPKYLPLTRESGARFAPKDGEVVVVLPDFLLQEGIDAFRHEAAQLFEEHGQRRDVTIGTTERHLRTVNGEEIQNGDVIALLMQSRELLDFIRGVIGRDDLEHYGDTNETCVLLSLEKAGDCHGTHLDEFSGVFNIAIEAPDDTELGGALRFVPGRNDETDTTGPGSQEVRLRPGDAYLMYRSDLTAHEVTPLTQDGSKRIIAGIALSHPEERDKPSRSSTILFGKD